MALTGIVGEMRSGKTLLMTMLMYREFLKNPHRRVFTNYHIRFSKDILDPNELDKAVRDQDTGLYDGAVIGLDEIGTMMDARTSGQKRNRMLGYLITQSGKLSCDIYYTSQFLRLVDVRLRLNTQTLYKVRRFVHRHGRRVFLRQEDKRTDFSILVQKYRLGETRDDFGFILQKTIVLKDPKRFFKLYDTLERVYYKDTIDELEKESHKRRKEDAE